MNEGELKSLNLRDYRKLENGNSFSHGQHALKNVHSAGCINYRREDFIKPSERSESTPNTFTPGGPQSYSRPLDVIRVEEQKERTYSITEQETAISCYSDKIYDPNMLWEKVLELSRKYLSMRRLQEATRSITAVGVKGGISSQDLVLERIIDAASEIMQAERITLFLIDDKSQELFSALSNFRQHEVGWRFF